MPLPKCSSESGSGEQDGYGPKQQKTPSLAESLMQSQSLPPSASLTSPALMSVPARKRTKTGSLAVLASIRHNGVLRQYVAAGTLMHDAVLMALDKYKTAEVFAERNDALTR